MYVYNSLNQDPIQLVSGMHLSMCAVQDWGLVLDVRQFEKISNESDVTLLALTSTKNFRGTSIPEARYNTFKLVPDIVPNFGWYGPHIFGNEYYYLNDGLYVFTFAISVSNIEHESPHTVEYYEGKVIMGPGEYAWVHGEYREGEWLLQDTSDAPSWVTTKSEKLVRLTIEWYQDQWKRKEAGLPPTRRVQYQRGAEYQLSRDSEYRWIPKE